MPKTYRATCHCGRVVVEAELDLGAPSYRCNCSICRRTRFWPAIARADGFRLVAGEDELTRYTFGAHRNHHYFCRHCGVRVYGVGNDTPIGTMYGINIGCLVDVPDAELARIPVTRVDGMHDRWDCAPEHGAHL